MAQQPWERPEQQRHRHALVLAGRTDAPHLRWFDRSLHSREWLVPWSAVSQSKVSVNKHFSPHDPTRRAYFDSSDERTGHTHFPDDEARSTEENGEHQQKRVANHGPNLVPTQCHQKAVHPNRNLNVRVVTLLQRISAPISTAQTKINTRAEKKRAGRRAIQCRLRPPEGWLRSRVRTPPHALSSFPGE